MIWSFEYDKLRSNVPADAAVRIAGYNQNKIKTVDLKQPECEPAN